MYNFCVTDDSLVSYVDNHRQFMSAPIEIKRLPFLLQSAIFTAKECVYVKVTEFQLLVKYL